MTDDLEQSYDPPQDTGGPDAAESDPAAAPGGLHRGRELVLRIDDEVGTIEPGKLADLTVFGSNPLDDPLVSDEPEQVNLPRRPVHSNTGSNAASRGSGTPSLRPSASTSLA